jgi:phospholipase/lecithinase/hemolysin
MRGVVKILCILLIFVAVTSAIDGNIYTFAASYADTGNYYWAFGQYREPWVQDRFISPGSGILIGPLGRFSSGLNSIDIAVEEYDLTLYNSLEITQLPEGTGNYVNFAIGGACAQGNVFNTYPHNTPSYVEALGGYGYLSQLSLFIQYKDRSTRKVTSSDIFYIGTVGANDIPAIGSSKNITELFSSRKASIEGYLTLIETLYTHGAKQIVVTYFDPLMFSYLPILTYANANLAQLAEFYFYADDGFVTVLSNRASKLMPDLNLILIPMSDFVGEISLNPTQYGIRSPIHNDYDPRSVDEPHFPFPTYYDMFHLQGVRLDTTFFYDYVHPTEYGHRALAQFEKRMYDGFLDTAFDIERLTYSDS